MSIVNFGGIARVGARSIANLIRGIGSMTRIIIGQNPPVYEATIISRNPDGTLNVDDGRGGCQRVVAQQNLRVGERARVGAAPEVGVTTFEVLGTLPLAGSARDCPVDLRGVFSLTLNADVMTHLQKVFDDTIGDGTFEQRVTGGVLTAPTGSLPADAGVLRQFPG